MSDRFFTQGATAYQRTTVMKVVDGSLKAKHSKYSETTSRQFADRTIPIAVHARRFSKDRSDARVAAALERRSQGRRSRRVTALLQASRRGACRAGQHHSYPAHAYAGRRGHGRSRRVRSHTRIELGRRTRNTKPGRKPGLGVSSADGAEPFRKSRVRGRRIDVPRPINDERGAFARFRLNLNLAAVFVDDVLHRPQPHAIALGALGGLAELEDSGKQRPGRCRCPRR